MGNIINMCVYIYLYIYWYRDIDIDIDIHMSIWEYIRSEMGYINYIQLKMESGLRSWHAMGHGHPDIINHWVFLNPYGLMIIL
jgi:hypothetical protein